MDNITQNTSNKILIKNILLNLLGMIIPLIVGIVCIPYAIKGLSIEGFGVLSLLWVVLSYFSLLDFGISRATTKFAAENIMQQNEEKLISTFWTAIGLSFLFGICSAIVVYFFIPTITGSLLKISESFQNQATIALTFFTLFLPFLLIATSLRGMLGAAQRFDVINAILIPTNILNFLIPALSYPLKLNLMDVILLICISRFVACCCYFLCCFKKIPLLRSRPIIDFGLIKKIINYGGWVTVSSVVSPILAYLDRFFIGSVISVNAVTYYTAPFEAVDRLRIIPIALMTTFFPEFSAISSTKNNERLEMLCCRSIKYVLISIGILSMMLIFYAPHILQVWLGSSFAEKSTMLFRIFAFGIVINALAFIPYNLLQGVGKPDLPAKFHLIELPFYIFLLFLLSKKYGINGVACGWLVRVTLDFCLNYIWSLKVYPNMLSSIGKNKIWHEAITLLTVSACWLAIELFFQSLLIKTILLIMTLPAIGLILWYKIIDQTEKQYLNLLFQKYSFMKTSGNV